MLSVKNWQPWELLTLKVCILLIAFPLMTFMGSMVVSYGVLNALGEDFLPGLGRAQATAILLGGGALLAWFPCRSMWPRQRTD